MARTPDQFMQEQIIGLMLRIAQLQSEHEALREEHAALKAAACPHCVPSKESGQ